MEKKILAVIVSAIIAILLAYGLRNEWMIIPGYIASILTFIYFEMPNKK
jgi:hypothetical protein